MKAALLISAVLAMYAVQAAAHYGHSQQKWSVYNAAKKKYMPIGTSHDYTMYYINVKVNATFIEMYDADPKDNTLTTIVSAGNILDKKTGRVVGHFDGSNLVTHATTKPGAPASVLQNTVMELGPKQDDTLVISGGYEAALGSTQVSDHDLAIVGGTGEFRGATGDAEVVGIDGIILSVYVPRLPKMGGGAIPFDA